VEPHNPVPKLFNGEVPKSRQILIHNGNKPEHTKGCLLVGTGKGTNTVSNSVAMLGTLKEFIDEKGIESVSVVISASFQ
jgi:hypothetical protein